MSDFERHEREIAELRKKKSEYEGLLSHPGWLRFCNDLDAQVRARKMMEFNSNLASMDEAFKAAGERGEIRGLTLAKDLAKFMLQEAKADIANWLENDRAMREDQGEKDGD